MPRNVQLAHFFTKPYSLVSSPHLIEARRAIRLRHMSRWMLTLSGPIFGCSMVAVQSPGSLTGAFIAI
jgi:hypothetical protein